ncbi:hypothetical protein G3I19_15580 [Streptomyces sp. SID10853]|uniref:hypothetical protein n=1 Tax=Streptomyces sp. SID10853 TaxID=2706028 RepID=UPI0013C16AA5|nr:hypothetical protein [Streptomyces sp. SID10853]NDZ79907.1 hypothetical protein [Streptomyces sp. SID10853]
MPIRSARYGLSTAALVAAGLALTACGSGDATSASGSSAGSSAPTSSAQSSAAPTDKGGQGSTDAAPPASADPSTTQGAAPGPSKGTRHAQQDCGPDQTGLEVIVPSSTTATSCATARAVANAYAKDSGAGGKSPVTVTVAGVAWLCQEQQGGIDPYMACANTADSTQTVRMSS